jgi:hypothetical protein
LSRKDLDVANHRFDVKAIEKPQALRNQAKAIDSLCDSCRFQYEAEHYNICDASIQQGGEVGLRYVVQDCLSDENRRR